MTSSDQKLVIDAKRGILTVESADGTTDLPLYSPEAFTHLSRWWTVLGWQQKYVYTFTWLGRPIIQLPEDLLRVQEAIFTVRPTLIIETGVAHGGSLVFYASLCRLLGRGRVVGIELELREHNRRALRAHPLASHIELIEGSSTDPGVLDSLSEIRQPDDKVMVILDSDHSYEHVSAELGAYHSLVSVESFLVVQDGIMRHLAGVPAGSPAWVDDNPLTAISEFLHAHQEFHEESPPRLFDEGQVAQTPTYWPHGWLRRVEA